MEKCEFCSRKVLFGKKDMSNLLGARPVVLGEGEPVKRLDCGCSVAKRMNRVYYTSVYRITAVKKT
ncbi:hypothetical protein [Coprococcus comes]|uniref:hypothetical protein n=1 Tax=Coprococcus comes TaxID=410072 RepID=UPI00189771D9|nr:hypothetical protein [Coprococcus comes]